MRKLFQDITVFDLLNGRYVWDLPKYYAKGHKPGLQKPERELLEAYKQMVAGVVRVPIVGGLLSTFTFYAVPKNMNAMNMMLRSKRIGEQIAYSATWDAMVYKALNTVYTHDHLKAMREGDPLYKCPVLITYQTYRTGVMDDDNNDASRKVVIDSLVHNGVIANDDRAHCRSVSLPYIYVPHKKDQHTEIKIEPLLPEARFKVVQSAPQLQL